jgi:hypothetical protein
MRKGKVRKEGRKDAEIMCCTGNEQEAAEDEIDK